MLAGLARATLDEQPLEEALGILEPREGYSFNFFFGCDNPATLLELARAADAFGQRERSDSLIARAREAGCC